MEKTRLEAFSDGVIAIIITIMVLELKIPEGHEWNDLFPLSAKFLSYMISFITIGIYWGNHHHLVHTATRVTSGFMLANLHLLFWLSLIPFTTGWMGQSNFSEKPVALYSFNLFASGMAFYILKMAIERTAEPIAGVAHAFKKLSWKAIISQVTYFISIPLAFIYPVISVALTSVIAIVWLLPDRGIEKAIQ